MRVKWIKVLVIFSLVIISKNAQAQLDNYWAWGEYHSLDFNTRLPKAGSSNTSESGSSICDSAGKLLFYCNRYVAYDRNNHIMPYFINGLNTQLGDDKEIITPKNKYEYYIFGPSHTTATGDYYMLYTLIDIRLNNGYGDVENRQLSDTLYKGGFVALSNLETGSFYSVGVAHKKGGGYWLLSKTHDSLYAFPVDSHGVGKPVLTYMYERLRNVTYYDISSYNYTITASNDSKMVVTTCPENSGSGGSNIAITAIYVYDFNNTTGQFNNQRLLASDSSIPYSSAINYGPFYNCAFSPNDSLFYVTHEPPDPDYRMNYHNDIIYQFQRFAPNIASSVYKIQAGDSSTYIQNIKSAPDGKIYLSYFKYNATQSSWKSTGQFGIINYPDRIGSACGLNLNGFNCPCATSTPDGQCWPGVFPLTINGYTSLSFAFSGQCGPLNFTAKSDSLFTKFTWYMQDINGNNIDSVYGSRITYSFKKSGRYIVTLQGMSKAGYKKWYTDTISFTTKPAAHFSVSQGNLCQYNHILFTNKNQADTSGESWHWDFGDPGSGSNSSALPAPTHIYSSTGVYKVKLSAAIGACKADTSMAINILPAPKPGFSVSDSVGCQPLTIQVTDQSKGSVTGWKYVVQRTFPLPLLKVDSLQNASFMYEFLPSGQYKIHQYVTGPNGCVTQDSATIMVNSKPSVQFERTDSVCLGTEIEFGFPSVAGYVYSWTSIPAGFISNNSKPIDVPKASTTYNLKETISATGCSDSGKVLYCFVEQRPVGSFTYEHTRGFDYRFAIKRSKYVSYNFDFGDSQHVSLNKNDTVVSHSFPGNGKYIVTLSALSDTGLKCESTFTDTIIVNEPFSLNIFPNPFSLQTDINYMLLKPGHVKISLTDDIGRQVGTLIDKELGPGEYDTYFNAPLWETRPGMYFVIFQLDDTLIVKKIIQMESIFY